MLQVCLFGSLFALQGLRAEDHKGMKTATYSDNAMTTKRKSTEDMLLES